MPKQVSAAARELEREFLHEFRSAALKWSAYAAFAGGLLFLMFALIAELGEPHTSLMQWVRVCVGVLLLAVSLCMRFGLGVDSSNYVWVAGFSTTVALLAAVVIPILPGEAARNVAGHATPALMFALFLHYSFLRLPLFLAAGVGWVLWVAAIVVFANQLSVTEMVRLGVYLGFANLFGMLVSHLIEARERGLFFETRSAVAAREAARVKQQLAEEAVLQKTRLIAEVNHDLRQPMTAALAYLEVMISRLSSEDLAGARAQAMMLQSSLTMLGSTLDHLLTVARYDSGRETLCIRPVELRPVLQGLYETYIQIAESRGVELRIRLPRKIRLVNTDLRSLRRILGNLVSNAIKFNSPRLGGGRVLVTARFWRDRCQIDVFDTGIGIDRESFDDIWKPYVQLNSAERSRERGLGLGLFLVERIVAQLPGHDIKMTSCPGRGSRFTISLSACSSSVGVERPGWDVPVFEPRTLTALAGLHVRVIDDDSDTRRSLVALLEEWHVDVVATASHELCLGEQRIYQTDALICDFRLAGGTNGLDAIARLREHLGYSPPAIVITGESDIGPLRDRAGPDTVVLQKPFAAEALARPLLEAVQSARAREAA